jgi:hypothetical protein
MARTIAGKRERGKNVRSAIVLAVLLSATTPAMAQSPDISARRLLEGWKTPDEEETRELAEVIASAFASGLTWSAQHGDKAVYCPPAALKGGEVMSALERYIAGHPEAAEKAYSDALAAALSAAFPCGK